jgi:hypothetical protein
MARLVGTLINKAASVIATIERLENPTCGNLDNLDKAVQSARLGELAQPPDSGRITRTRDSRTWRAVLQQDMGGAALPLEQAKPNDYFQLKFQGSAVHVVGFGVWWQGLSSLRIRQWLDIPETTPHIAYQKSRSIVNAVVLPTNKKFHVQVVAGKTGISQPRCPAPSSKTSGNTL